MAKPTVEEKQMPPPKAAPQEAPKKAPYLPAPIEEINQSMAVLWDQLGHFQKLKITKEALLRHCNMQEMPLLGLDVIPTQQGLKLYINGEGAKFNRERYLHQSGRRMIERKVEILDYDKVPGADAARDKAQGRVYFRILTTVEDVDQKAQIVHGVATGTIKAADVPGLLDALKVITTYETRSAYSYQSEKFQDNRQPDIIIKKGITQCHRRADLEISSQCVIPEDEETVDAVFTVKASEMFESAKSGAALPGATLVPEKVVATQTPVPKAPVPTVIVDAPGPEGGEKKSVVTEPAKPTAAPAAPEDAAALNGLLKDILTAGKVASRADRIKWFNAHGFPTDPTKITVEILKKAIDIAKKEFPETGEAPPAEPAGPKLDAATKTDPERHKAIQKIFGMREKALFEGEDPLRAWVKETWGKGMSEMSAPELHGVLERVQSYTDFLGTYNTRGFASPKELMVYAAEAKDKPFHQLSPQDLKEVGGDLDQMIA